MNQGECSKDEVVYLVPCVKKLTASLLNSSSEIHSKLLNICQTDTGTVNLTNTVFKDCNVLKVENNDSLNLCKRKFWEVFDKTTSKHTSESKRSLQLLSYHSQYPTDSNGNPANDLFQFQKHVKSTIACRKDSDCTTSNAQCKEYLENPEDSWCSMAEKESSVLDPINDHEVTTPQNLSESEDSINKSFVFEIDKIIEEQNALSKVKLQSPVRHRCSNYDELNGSSLFADNENIHAEGSQQHKILTFVSDSGCADTFTLKTSPPRDFGRTPQLSSANFSSLSPLAVKEDIYCDKRNKYDRDDSCRDIQTFCSFECNESSTEKADVCVESLLNNNFIRESETDVNEKILSEKTLNNDAALAISEFETLLFDSSTSSPDALDVSHFCNESFPLGDKECSVTSGSKHQVAEETTNHADLTFEDIISDVGNILDEYQTTTSNYNSTAVAVNKLPSHLTSVSEEKDFSIGNIFNIKSPLKIKKQENDSSMDFDIDVIGESHSSVQLHMNSYQSTELNSDENESQSGSLQMSEHDFNIRSIFDDSKFFDPEFLMTDVKSQAGYFNKVDSYSSMSNISNNTLRDNNYKHSLPIPLASKKSDQPKKDNVEPPGIPTKVAFKVRPAGKTGKYLDKWKTVEKLPQSMTKPPVDPVGGKDKKLKNDKSYQFDEKCSKTMRDLYWNHGKGKGKKYTSYKSCSGGCSFSCREPTQQKSESLVLPVGKTGLSVTIPSSIKTNVISFLPSVGHICKDLDKLSSSSQANTGSNIVSSTPSCKKNSDSPSTSSSTRNLVVPSSREINAPVTSLPNSSKCNASISHRLQTSRSNNSAGTAVPVTSSVITLHNSLQAVYNLTFPQTTSYMMVTDSYSQNSDIANDGIPLTKASNGSTTIHNESSYIYPTVQMDSKDSSEKNSFEPIKITIRTKQVQVSKETECASKDGTNNGIPVSQPSSMFKITQSGIANISNTECPPDSLQRIPRNKNLGNELKVHFPTVPESILQQLTIPPQALHRGYLTANDLQNIRTQALKLHLGIIYRNHVTKCKTPKCEICRTFVAQQDSLSWTAREKLFKPKKQGKGIKHSQGQFKARKVGRRCHRNRSLKGEEDDPTYEPPLSYFNAWKRKSNHFWYNPEHMQFPNAKTNFTCRNMPECYMLLNNIWQVENSYKKNGSFMGFSGSKCRSEQLQNQISNQSDIGSSDNSGTHTVSEDCHFQNEIRSASIAKEVSQMLEGGIENVNQPNPQVPEVSVMNVSSTGGLLSKLEDRKDSDDISILPPWEEPYRSPDTSSFNSLIDETTTNNNDVDSRNASSYQSQSYAESRQSLQSLPLGDPMQYLPSIYLDKGCGCEGSCRRMECPCAHGGVMCNAGLQCSCRNCDNPLNILHEFKLDVHIARVDECLMQNLYSYDMADLRKLMSCEVILPCCSATLKLQYIIPSTVICTYCGSAVSYSWCTNSIHVQTVYPRNHCILCCSCKPSLHTHCQGCRQCTPSVNQGSCSDCGTTKLFAV